MAKIKAVVNSEDQLVGYSFYCPGCKCPHVVYVAHSNVIWGFNGDLNNPTFTPSVRCTWGHYVDGHPKPPDCEYCNEEYGSCGQCHFFVTNGKIDYCGDCTHELSGKLGVEMRDIEADRLYKNMGD